MRIMRLLVAINVLLLVYTSGFSQTVAQKLTSAVNNLLKDGQMKHAIMSLYVIDASTGKAVYDYNSQFGLAPASAQKIFTAAAALEFLGADYKYKTTISYTGSIKDNILLGDLYLTGFGDPTLGSWRYASTKREMILEKIAAVLKSNGINSIRGNIVLDNSGFSYQPIPGGWLWDDMGNYYGAGVWALNWNENQYDLLLKPGKQEMDEVEIIGTKPLMNQTDFINHLKTGKPKSGDHAYIYLAPYSNQGFIEGTVPAGERSFTISGSLPNPAEVFGEELKLFLNANQFQFSGNIKNIAGDENSYSLQQNAVQLPESIYSPTLDSMVYWFLQKSINLYGEAFVKTFALESAGFGATDKGVEWLKKFWQQNGIEASALNIQDGSGLSPQNRVTAQSLVQALQFAKSRPWFQGFYKAMPLYNNLKMKSGTIGGVKSFAGYSNAKNGKSYTYAIIINNFDGSAASIVQKMFTVLNELK